MPAKQDDSWRQYFNKLNKTLSNFEQRLEKLENQVGALTRKSTKASVESPAAVEYESPPKRRLGWSLIWLSIFLYIVPWFGFYFIGDIIPHGFRGSISLGLLIAGIVLVLTNPKLGRAVKTEKKEVDLGQESLDYPAKKATAKVESAKKAQISKGKSDLEANIGKKWLPKIGIISIVLGVAFFVIYAIQNKWIGPTGQIALGALAGVVLIALGEIFYRKEYENYGLTLVGGGFAIIYFAMFAAYRFYGDAINISLPVDVASLSIIIMAAVYFSIRYDSKIIAAEAFFLGYAVPLLTSSVNTFFLIYAIALTAGLIALTCFKNWKLLGAAGIAAMYITHIFWLDSYTGDSKNLLHILFLFIYFAMFAVMALKTEKEAKEEFESWINSKIILGAVFIVTYIFLFQLDFSNVFIVAAPLILLLIILAFFLVKFRWNYFAAGGILMTYFVHWKWLGQNFNESSVFTNFIGLSIYFVLFNVLLFMLNEQKNKTGNVAGILLNSALYYGLNAWPSFYFPTGYRGLFTAALSVFYLVFSYLAYNRKISHYFNTYIVLCFGYLALTIPLQFNQEWITISWAAMTLVLVVLSFRLQENAIRIFSLIVGIITFGKVLFYDSWSFHAIDFANFLNSTRLFNFAAAIIVFYVIAYLYYKNKDEFEDYEDYIVKVNASYAIAATLLTTVIIWLEIWDTSIAINAKKLWTSIAFILQAIIILGFGFSGKIKLFRIMGLLLFGMSIIKVFLYDLSNLETGYRIISFIVLGVIALLGAFLYNKYREYI